MFPLHLAALSGFSDCCRKLLSSGHFITTHVKGKNEKGFTNFVHISLSYAGFDIDTPDDFGRTCLHAAAAGG